MKCPRAGVVLVEWLLALGLSGAVMLLAISAVNSTGRFVTRLGAQVELLNREVAVPQLLATQLAGVGRGVLGCALAVVDSGRRLRWQTQPSSEALEETLELFADVDSAKRPALYLRRLPNARQPWLEGVVGFSVREVSLSRGGWVLPPGPATERVDRLRLELLWEEGGRSEMIIDLLHAPCLASAG